MPSGAIPDPNTLEGGGDTDTNPYANILNVIGNQSRQDDRGGLTTAQQADNYSFFSSEIMGKGVYLPDLARRMKEMEDEIARLKSGSKADVDRELFSVMEAAVRSDPGVRRARQHVADVKTDIITEMCMKDPRYTEAWDEYRRTVNAAYIASKEVEAPDGTGAPEVRDEPRRD